MREERNQNKEVELKSGSTDAGDEQTTIVEHGEMNKTKCCECGREINLPDGVDADYDEAEKKAEYPFCLPIVENGEYLDPENGAYCDPEYGGYWCSECYEKVTGPDPVTYDGVMYKDEIDGDEDWTGRPVTSTNGHGLFGFECLRCGHTWSDECTPSYCANCGGDEVWHPPYSLGRGCVACGRDMVAWFCPRCRSMKVESQATHKDGWPDTI